jgi:single-strand DNA-binding protein
MNVLTFSGNLGSDCEIRFTKSGTQITQFSVALNSGYGERKMTNWVRCNIWGERGNALAPYLTKGQQVVVSGELSQQEWTNKDGENKASLEVKVNDVTLVGKREDHKPAAATRPPARKEHAPVPQPETFDLDDDIPF